MLYMSQILTKNVVIMCCPTSDFFNKLNRKKSQF